VSLLAVRGPTLTVLGKNARFVVTCLAPHIHRKPPALAGCTPDKVSHFISLRISLRRTIYFLVSLKKFVVMPMWMYASLCVKDDAAYIQIMWSSCYLHGWCSGCSGPNLGMRGDVPTTDSRACALSSRPSPPENFGIHHSSRLKL